MSEATLPHDIVRFAHNSERQFAKLLDFYGPAYDLYIEITTLNQKLVTKKNRKARRLRELHPEIRIKVLYQRDYLHLLVKYGLEPPSQLSEQLGEGAPLRFDVDAPVAAARPTPE